MIGMFCGVSTNVLADATTIGVDQTYSLATITNGTETIEVPVVQKRFGPFGRWCGNLKINCMDSRYDGRISGTKQKFGRAN